METVKVEVLVPSHRLAEFYSMVGRWLARDVDALDEEEGEKKIITEASQYSDWGEGDTQKAFSVYRKLTDVARSIFDIWIDNPEERFSGFRLAREVGIENTYQIAGTLSWPSRYALGEHKKLPFRFNPEDGSYWMDETAANVFAQARGLFHSGFSPVQRFFLALMNKISQSYPKLECRSSPQKPPTRYLRFSTGITGFYYFISVNLRRKSSVSVSLYLDPNNELGVDPIHVFAHLVSQKDEIQKEIGVEDLMWNESMHEAREIIVYKDGSIDDIPERVISLQEWSIQLLERFYLSLSPRLERIKNP